ncbi:hypothetical protein QUF63_01280 [Anaerolineales bacterium HSG25]|nr:hypothetical protein [Anaerolineales bacterium HSG25]
MLDRCGYYIHPQRPLHRKPIPMLGDTMPVIDPAMTIGAEFQGWENFYSPILEILL